MTAHHLAPARPAYFRPLVLAAAVVAITTIMVGGYTSATESGMGCGDDWPHCNGTLTPDLEEFTTRVEWTHRLSAITLGTIGLVLLGYTVRNKDHLPTISRRGVYVAAGLFMTQALLGAMVVWTHLRAELVAAHAGVAAALFTSLLVAWLSSGSSWPGTSTT